MTQQAQLADDLQDRPETLLDDPDLSEAMRLDEIQGFLCAALAGPQAIKYNGYAARLALASRSPGRRASPEPGFLGL
jgi:hypothetical protein